MAAVGNQQRVLYLMERPAEPLFIPKGNRKATFNLPSSDYLVDRYRPLADDLGNRFGEETTTRIAVQNIQNFPDLSIPSQLGRRDRFSIFHPRHRDMATKLIEIFMSIKSYDEFMSTAVYSRDRVNPDIFVYAFAVAILHRPDTKGLRLPPITEIFPDKFVDGSVFTKAKLEAGVVKQDSRVPIVIPKDYTASDLEEEHRVAYFREDLGINSHHWHWHAVYPLDGPREVVAKDRRGELFYYMHQQIIARYNFERFCNKLGRVKRLHDFREPIPEAYFPKLQNTVSSRIWPSRFADSILKDINRDDIQLDIQDMERWRDRIIEAIQVGRVVHENGKSIDLTEMGGIDVLGDIIEASSLSLNKNLYGNLHNFGHVMLGLCHDPDNRYLESFGVIGTPSTAMRDPAFYRWHAFVDELFQMHKRTIPSYSTNQLGFQGIKIVNVEVNSKGNPKNELSTFWQERDIELSHGMDFLEGGSVFARVTHLQHTPFSYKIQVENSSNSTVNGTVRIFLAPKFDERRLPMIFRDQRLFFVELDKFTFPLKPKMNEIIRSSKDSSVTIPFERTYDQLESAADPGTDESNYCGCGWPENMLIPKGDSGGYPCELFVMVSNAKDDMVEQPKPKAGKCDDAASFCGIRDSKYPDKRSMGYPFDRVPRTGVTTLKEFLTPNMMVVDVKIIHTDRTEPPPKA